MCLLEYDHVFRLFQGEVIQLELQLLLSVKISQSENIYNKKFRKTYFKKQSLRSKLSWLYIVQERLHSFVAEKTTLRNGGEGERKGGRVRYTGSL